MKNTNPYLSQVWAELPRLLALYDRDVTSSTFGQGDRYRWAWKLIDFGNGTFQGAAHGLARLLTCDLLPPEFSKARTLERIDSMFQGAEALRRPNGSMEEALPFESSFCVTALVAYDLLTAIELLRFKYLSGQKVDSYLNVVRPMIRFLHRSDETHAFISNHLATAATALYKWHALTGEPGSERGWVFLERILKEQSDEGWFREYEGADPGYQTLCTYYLADLHKMRPDLGLAEALGRSIRFLWYFAHPDGSFGGFYGSRNTRFYYPAGIESLSGEVAEAEALATFMRRSIKDQSTVTLSVIDEPNLVPMFNAYCWAATKFEQSTDYTLDDQTTSELPALSSGRWRKEFPQAGLFINKGENDYAVVSWHKGGVCYLFNDLQGNIDTGVVARDDGGKLYSTQGYRKDNQFFWKGDTLVIISPFSLMPKPLPSPWQFLVLRILCLTLMKNAFLGGAIKKALVRLLITGRKSSPVMNRREICFGEEPQVVDEIQYGKSKLKKVPVSGSFGAIHMASQGYWQRQDDIQ